MKRIRLTLLAVAALLVTIGVSAQPFGRMSSTERAEQITEQLTRELKLDTKQSKRVKKIYTTFFDAMQANRPQMGQFPPMGGPGGPFGGMPPQGGFPNMGNGEFPPMDQFPGMMDEDISQSEMDKAINKRDKNMRKILNDKQYNEWVKFEHERMSNDFNRIEKGPQGKGPKGGPQGHGPHNGPQSQRSQRPPQRGQFPQR